MAPRYLIVAALGGCVLVAVAVAAALVRPAADPPPLPATSEAVALRDGPAGRVAEIVDGDTLILDSGLEVRLVGIQAPKLPLGRAGFAAWPLADEAKEALGDLVLGRDVTLRFGGRKSDRYGRALAHVHRDDGLWVQGRMIEDGLARVYPFADNRARVTEMLAAENRARTAGKGIWDRDFYRVLDHRDAARGLDSYALVEGTVVAAAEVRGRGFLNFGDDYRTDFTITIAPDDLDDRFAAADIALDDYVGARVRVRGWLKRINGVSVDVTHPEQIEILAPPPR